MNEQRKLITRGQALVMIPLILSAVALLVFLKPTSEKSAVAVITVRGEKVRSVNLSTAPDETITLDNGVVIEVKDGKIGFVSSGCRDKICVNTGMLFSPGQSAACVPESTVISLEGEGAVDVISY